ncbi:MAG: 1-acyl-sn-glycerol-3-phosphate acyltransferase, partial [Nitrospinae bacterium]|nr:1-acyl-sn-glycerol-3-phosphate acyltransferase [Nitrospinota bacterium]
MIYSPREQRLAFFIVSRSLDALRFLLRFILWRLTHTIYRIKILGKENIPRKGPALLVSNHVTFADPFIIGSCIFSRFIRFMIFREYFNIRPIKWFLNLMKVIPISESDSPKVKIHSFKMAKEE